jgi:hypothetical protein
MWGLSSVAFTPGAEWVQDLRAACTKGFLGGGEGGHQGGYALTIDLLTPDYTVFL